MSITSLHDFSEALADAVDRIGRSVVAVHGSRHGHSSGVIWKPGVIVTSAHAIRRDEGIRITLPDGSHVHAALAGADGSTDLAVLKLDDQSVPVVDVDASATVRAGQFVFAVGRDAHAGALASSGIVSGVGGEWRTWRGGRIDRFIRLDGGLHGGFGGAPIGNTAGKVIGIGTSALAREFGVVIPASTIERVVQQLLSSGKIAHGFLGVGMQPVALSEPIAQKLGLDRRSGLIVLSLAPNGPAEQAGVLVGDVLIGLNGAPLDDIGDLQAALPGDSIGQPLTVDIVRGGERVQSSIVPAERPQRRC